MHPNSMRLMSDFANQYREIWTGKKVLDIGSQDINGSYRELFSGCQEYIGVDIIPGKGVDVLAKDIDKMPFADETFECIISGQTLEHAAHPWILVKEIARMLRPGGIICLIAPWRFYEHKDGLCPFDRWRIMPDGMIVLISEAGLDVVAAFMNEDDCVGIGRKRGVDEAQV